MALHTLLDQNAGHVADRSGLRLGQSRQSGTEILWQNHLNARGLGLPAG